MTKSFKILAATILFITANSAFALSTGPKCKSDYENCKARAFSEKSTCRLAYDKCLVNEDDTGSNSSSLQKTSNTENSKKKTTFEL